MGSTGRAGRTVAPGSADRCRNAAGHQHRTREEQVSFRLRRPVGRRSLIFTMTLALMFGVAVAGNVVYTVAVAGPANAATTVTRASIVDIASAEVGNSEANGRCKK